MRDVKKILIIRFSSLGDIILASPLVRVLRAAYPSAQIDFLCKAQYADVVRYNSALSSVLLLGTSGRNELHRLKDRIKAERYGLILDCHNSLRSRYLRWLSGARDTLVVNKHMIARWLLVNLKWNVYRSVVSVADRYLGMIRPLGLVSDGLGLDVFVPDDVVRSVQTMMEKYRLDRYEHIIGCAPGARHFTKRWPIERYIEFGVKSAKSRRTKIFIFGGIEEEELCNDMAQMINSEVGASVAESVAGKLSLLGTAAAMDYCHVVVTNDTGLMHLAAARKRKIVALFGSTVKELGFYPYGTEAVVIEKEVGCRPCSHIGRAACPKGHFRCMKEIIPDEVVNTVNQVFIETLPITETNRSLNREVH